MMPYYRGRVLQLPNVRRDILQENGKLLLMIDITFVFVWYVSGNSVNFCSVGSEEIHTIVLARYRINVIWFQTYVKLAWNSHHMKSVLDLCSKFRNEGFSVTMLCTIEKKRCGRRFLRTSTTGWD